MKMKFFAPINLLIFCFTGFSFQVFSQDLQNEMFFNDNSIINESVLNDKIKKNFEKINKSENIKVFIEQKDETRFSIFIKNSSNGNLILLPQDNSLYLIQEAIDKKGDWKPIEFWGFSTCGNSYNKEIHFNPNQIIELDSPKYKGDFSTKIRFKLRLNNQIYYSNSLPSTINVSKFQKSKWFIDFVKMFKMFPDTEDWVFLNKEAK